MPRMTAARAAVDNLRREGITHLFGLPGAPILPAQVDAKKLLVEHRVPVIVEVILERVTNISMGTEIDNIVEFEELAIRGEDAPTAISALNLKEMQYLD